MKRVLLLSTLLCTLATYSQNFNWAQQIGGPQDDASNAIVTDNSGNSYTTGKFAGIVDFDAGPGTFTMTASGGSDVFVTKLSPTGALIWAKKMGGIYNDAGAAITLDAAGNVLIAGTFSGTANFNTSGGTNSLTAFGMTDAFICKLDGSGNLVWIRQLGGTQDDYAAAITIDFFGAVYSTGSFVGTADFDPGVTTQTFISGGYSDIFVSKLDASGNYVWAKHFNGSTNASFGSSIKVDQSGNVYTTGGFYGTVDFDPGAASFPVVAQGTINPTCFVSKLDLIGNFVWAKQFYGNFGTTSVGTALVLDGSPNIFLTGYFAGSGVDFDPGAGVYQMSASVGLDIFVASLDGSGNFSWAKKMGGTGNTEIGTGISFDGSGNLIVTGVFSGTSDFDPGAATYSLSSIGNEDCFATKLSVTGNFIWAVQLGGQNNDRGNAITSFGQDIYVAGYFQNTADFDPSVGTYNLNSFGLTDAFLTKLSPACVTPSVPSNTTPASSLTICEGNAVALSASSGGAGIIWYTSNTGTTAIASGSVYTTSTLAVGSYTYYAEAMTCTNSIGRTPVTFTVISSPTVSIQVPMSTMCFGESSTLTASGANTYTWNQGTVNASIGISPTVTSSYTVTGQSTSGCINKSVVTVTVSDCLKTTELANNEFIRVYPNPAETKIHVQINHAMQVSVVNSMGQFMKTVFLNESNNYTITLDEFPQGIYYVVGKTGEELVKGKFIVSKESN